MHVSIRVIPPHPLRYFQQPHCLTHVGTEGFRISEPGTPYPSTCPCWLGSVPDVGGSVPWSEKAFPTTEEAFPMTEEALPMTEEAFPTTEEAFPMTEEAFPMAE